MVKPSETDREGQLTQLKDLYRKGLLSKENFQAAITGLGMDPTRVFNQLQQHVDHQTNVVGDVKGPLLSGKFGGPVSAGGGAAIDLRESHGAKIIQATTETSADPESLRAAYLHRLARQLHRLPLTGVDPKVATGEGSRDLELSAVYTALMTQRPETEGEAKRKRHDEHLSEAIAPSFRAICAQQGAAVGLTGRSGQRQEHFCQLCRSVYGGRGPG